MTMTIDKSLTTDKKLPTDHPEEYYTKPLGTAAVFGCRPEASFMYDGPVQERMTSWITSIMSTHDSLEKIFVPEPFKINRNVPPELKVMAFIERRRKRMDGYTEPYIGVYLAVSVVYTDSKGATHAGNHPLEYVCAAGGNDLTSIGSWLPYYGQTFGAYKPLANVTIEPDGDDTYDIYVSRCGKRIIHMSFTRGDEIILPKDSASNANVLANAASGSTRQCNLTLRQIPNVNFTSYSERSVCVFEIEPSAPIKMFEATATVELYNDERYLLGEVERVGMGKAMMTISANTKEAYTDHYVLEYLPVPEPALTKSQKDGTAIFVGDTRR